MTLTTGWETTLPDSDTLALRWLRHLVVTQRIFAEAAGGTVVVDDRFVLSDYGTAGSYFNGIVLLAPPDWPALLAEVEDRLAGGSGTVYLWSLWPTPDLRERGWELAGHPPVLVRPPAPAPSGPEPARVGSAAELAEWERVVVEGYPVPELLPFEAGTLAAPALLADPRLRLWVSRDGSGRAVSASAQVVAHGIASFAMGATRPEARRQGHWSAHARARLRAEPGLWHIGTFSDDSRPGAEGIGFVPLLRQTLWFLER